MDDDLSGCLNVLGLILSTIALVGWLCTTDVFSRGKPEPKPDDRAKSAASEGPTNCVPVEATEAAR